VKNDMRVKSKKTYGVVVVFLSVLTVSSLSTTPVLAQAPKYGGTLIQGLNTEPTTLAALRPTFFDIMASNGLYNTLVAFDKDLNWIPELAESWEIGPNGQYIRFNLRDDVYWHDGVKFSSADVKFTYDNAIKDNWPIGKYLKGVKEILTPDENTVIIKLKES